VSKHKHCKHYYKLLCIIKKKDEEIAELKKRLQYYENYNSPPSANSLLWKKQKKERRADGNNKHERRKLGRRDGHEGVSHSFRPSDSIEHSMDRCSRCSSSSISLKHQEYRLVVDVPAPEPYTVKEHIINIYHCKRCNSEVRPEADIPEHGMLGKNLLATIATLWSEARLPLGKIASMLKAVYGLKISAGTINNALVNVSESLQRFVNRVRSNINRAESAGFDETSISINGKKGWIWCAVSGNGNNAFITVENSRGADVLEKHFHAFDGIAVVDGWKAYNIFGKQQRCWAHIIREADIFALRIGNARAIELAESLKQLYHYMKSELKEHPPPDIKLYRRVKDRLRKILDGARRCRDKDVRKFVGKVRSAGSRLFTFLLYDTDSTNNDCERMLREVVIHRKIRGLLRNGKGMRMFGNIMTAVMTWKLRGLNILEEVRKYL
jgi:transposase